MTPIDPFSNFRSFPFLSVFIPLRSIASNCLQRACDDFLRELSGDWSHGTLNDVII